MLRGQDLPKMVLQYKLLSAAITTLVRAQEGNTTEYIHIYNITEYNNISYEIAYTLPNHSNELKYAVIARLKLLSVYNTLYSNYKNR